MAPARSVGTTTLHTHEHAHNLTFARVSPYRPTPPPQIGGVGKVTEKCLREAVGVVTCGDLFRERAACLHVMTPHTSRWLIKVRPVSLAFASLACSAELEPADLRCGCEKETRFWFQPSDLSLFGPPL